MSASNAHSPRVYNILFVCAHNSARSVLAEAIVNRLGSGRFRGFSAGSQPKGQVNSFAIRLLERLNYDTSDIRSKSWDEFAASGAPKMDFVFTVCDTAANETCPVWPGQPMSAHWGVPDPSEVKGSQAEIAAAFADTHRMLYQRISIFTNLPMGELDKMSLRRELERIGRSAMANETL